MTSFFSALRCISTNCFTKFTAPADLRSPRTGRDPADFRNKLREDSRDFNANLNEHVVVHGVADEFGIGLDAQCVPHVVLVEGHRTGGHA